MTRKSALWFSWHAEIDPLLTLLASLTVSIFMNLDEYHDFLLLKYQNSIMTQWSQCDWFQNKRNSVVYQNVGYNKFTIAEFVFTVTQMTSRNSSGIQSIFEAIWLL